MLKVLNSLHAFPYLRRLSGPSCTLLNKYFGKNTPVTLSKDHTTVAFSEDRTYYLIRVACDETAHTPFEMMSGLLQRASLFLNRPFPQPHQANPPSFSKFRSTTPLPSFAGTSAGSDNCLSSSDFENYTSGAIQTETVTSTFRAAQTPRVQFLKTSRLVRGLICCTPRGNLVVARRMSLWHHCKSKPSSSSPMGKADPSLRELSLLGTPSQESPDQLTR